MRDTIEETVFENEQVDLDFTDDDLFDLHFFEDSIFDIDRLIAEYNNQRKTVRYVRNDITASINQADIFGGYSLFSHSQSLDVKLLDVSSKGALIASPKKLRIKKKVLLTLIFDANVKFEITARVIRETPEARRLYGLKFDRINHKLGNHLLATQTHLIFK